MEESGNALRFHEGMRILARLIARRITNAHSKNRLGDFEERGLLPTEDQRGNDECQLLDENAAE